MLQSKKIGFSIYPQKFKYIFHWGHINSVFALWRNEQEISTMLIDTAKILMPSVESQLLDIISFICKFDPLGWLSYTVFL